MSEPMPEGGTGNNMPGPRTSEGRPTTKPGSLLPQAQGRDRTSEGPVELSPYMVEPYVPIPRPFAGGQALITTGTDPFSIPVNVDTTSVRGIKLASDINSIINADRYSKSDAEALWNQLPIETQNALTRIAKAQGGRSGKALWERSVASSYLSTKQGNPESPWDFVQKDAQSVGAAGVSGGAGGSSAGPRETVTMASERDLRAAVDAMAAQVLGRAATDDEFQNALKQVRSAEQTEPTITTRGSGRTVTQSGLTAEGRSSIIQESLMKGPEAEEFGKATKMMDLFYSALEARPSGA